jgi:hypothetical protein
VHGAEITSKDALAPSLATIGAAAALSGSAARPRVRAAPALERIAVVHRLIAMSAEAGENVVEAPRGVEAESLRRAGREGEAGICIRLRRRPGLGQWLNSELAKTDTGIASESNAADVVEQCSQRIGADALGVVDHAQAKIGAFGIPALHQRVGCKVATPRRAGDAIDAIVRLRMQCAQSRRVLARAGSGRVCRWCQSA